MLVLPLIHQMDLLFPTWKTFKTCPSFKFKHNFKNYEICQTRVNWIDTTYPMVQYVCQTLEQLEECQHVLWF